MTLLKEKRTFEVAKDKSFENVIFKKVTSQSSVSVPSRLVPGKYYWRMVNLEKDFMRTPVYPVKLYSYAVKLKKRSVYLDQLGIVKIPWQERIKEATYEVIIKDKNKKEIDRINVDGKFAKLPIKNFGDYFITVNPTAFNEILVPRVDHPLSIRKKSIPAPFTAKNTMLKRSHKLGLSKHILKLPKYDKSKFKQVHVEIYKDRNASRPVYKGKSKKSYHVWNTKKSGKFYYRLRAKSVDGKLTEYTKVKELLFPISPFFVTAVRVPAGKKRYYRFSYVVKKGDNLATILRNYTKSSTVLSNRSPMVQQIIKRNRHVKNWGRIPAGKKIEVYVSTDSLDKSFLYIYKKLFIVKG